MIEEFILIFVKTFIRQKKKEKSEKGYQIGASKQGINAGPLKISSIHHAPKGLSQTTSTDFWPFLTPFPLVDSFT